MEYLGYLLFIFMGITLGLIGAGGSILTIPILLYVFEIPILLATTYSLFIVGCSASLSMLWYKKYIVFKNALLFAIPSIAGIFIARFYILPNLPADVFGLSLEFCLLNFLSLIMLLAAYFMISAKTYKHSGHDKKSNTKLKIITLALALGVFMGIIGAGGGFLIIPVLVIILRMEMKSAIATSLFIIAINSAVGFIADRQLIDVNNYKQISLFVILSAIGMCIGIILSPRFSSNNLKKSFGWLIATVAASILIHTYIY